MTTPSSEPRLGFSIIPSVIASLFVMLCEAPIVVGNDFGVFLIFFFFGLPGLLFVGVALLVSA